MLEAAIEANVRLTLRALSESAERQKRIASGEMMLVVPICDLETGVVRFLA